MRLFPTNNMDSGGKGSRWMPCRGCKTSVKETEREVDKEARTVRFPHNHMLRLELDSLGQYPGGFKTTEFSRLYQYNTLWGSITIGPRVGLMDNRV